MLDVDSAAPRAEVPPAKPTFVVSNWHMSTMMERPPSPEWRHSTSAHLAGPTVRPGRLQQFADGRFALFHTRFEPRAAIRKDGGQLVFTDLVGKAQIWIDGKLVGEKSTPARQTLRVELPAGEDKYSVDVVIESAPGSHAGFGGAVIVE